MRCMAAELRGEGGSPGAGSSAATNGAGADSEWRSLPTPSEKHPFPRGAFRCTLELHLDRVIPPMPPRLYFAYGSNMSTDRLRERVERAHPVGRGRWHDMELTFNKRGVDGSGKANLMTQRNACAWGVLFDLHPDDWHLLDRFEPGYERTTCSVHLDTNELVEAQVYLAVPPLAPLPPHDWYRDHLLRGAEEHALPAAVIAMLHAIELL